MMEGNKGREIDEEEGKEDVKMQERRKNTGLDKWWKELFRKGRQAKEDGRGGRKERKKMQERRKDVELDK